MWTEQGIAVYGLRMPTGSFLVRKDERSGFRTASIAESFEEAGGIWVERREGEYRTYDGSHPDAQSAMRLSRSVAKEMLRDRSVSKSQALVRLP